MNGCVNACEKDGRIEEKLAPDRAMVALAVGATLPAVTGVIVRRNGEAVGAIEVVVVVVTGVVVVVTGVVVVVTGGAAVVTGGAVVVTGAVVVVTGVVVVVVVGAGTAAVPVEVVGKPCGRAPVTAGSTGAVYGTLYGLTTCTFCC